MFWKDSMVHNYPCFKFYLPLFLGKPVNWNKGNLKREGLHNTLESLRKDFFERRT